MQNKLLILILLPNLIMNKSYGMEAGAETHEYGEVPDYVTYRPVTDYKRCIKCNLQIDTKGTIPACYPQTREQNKPPRKPVLQINKKSDSITAETQAQENQNPVKTKDSTINRSYWKYIKIGALGISAVLISYTLYKKFKN